VGSIAWDFAATYGLPVQALGRCLVPGGIPSSSGTMESVREVTPLDFPNYITASGAANALYGGRLLPLHLARRHFLALGAAIGAQHRQRATITVPTLRNLLPGTHSRDRVVRGLCGRRVPAGGEAQRPCGQLDHVYFHVGGRPGDRRALYTTGGALDNAPLPPCKHVAVFQNRAILAATPGKRHHLGLAGIPRASRPPIQRRPQLDVDQGRGEVSALADCGLFLAMFRKDAIALISGPGPDGNATGNFVPQTIDVRETTDNFRGILPAERGAYFQANDGLIYQLQGANVVPVYAGMQSHQGERVIATALNATAAQAWFLTNGGVIMVLDYGHPTPDQPAGQWFFWSSAQLPVGLTNGACVDSAGTMWIAGQLRVAVQAGAGAVGGHRRQGRSRC
jgi:hypothetical protein